MEPDMKKVSKETVSNQSLDSYFRINEQGDYKQLIDTLVAEVDAQKGLSDSVLIKAREQYFRIVIAKSVDLSSLVFSDISSVKR